MWPNWLNHIKDGGRKGNIKNSMTLVCAIVTTVTTKYGYLKHFSELQLIISANASILRMLSNTILGEDIQYTSGNQGNHRVDVVKDHPH